MLNVINIDTGLFSGVLYNELTNGIISHCENAREVLCKQEMTKEADTEATIDEIKSALYDIVDRRAFEELNIAVGTANYVEQQYAMMAYVDAKNSGSLGITSIPGIASTSTGIIEWGDSVVSQIDSIWNKKLDWNKEILDAKTFKKLTEIFDSLMGNR